MDRVLRAATGRVRQHHDGTAKRCSLTEGVEGLGSSQQLGQLDDQTTERS